ncbi:metallopeptidase MepB [Cordyceps militaris CM01]|uniref:Metallopeptidase MepB n=1 Tax=Cordyceps militaris (strain CM01) TaxID=983644 RepID=G3J6U4_CORMM|nr:metallopeptidase MepB [Cordyceps militaris CM01]EGX96221.1 metallopeptidase MepB [Cordyceps militaris CM01]
MASEKFANPPQRPPMFSFTPEEIGATIDKIVATKRAAIDNVVAATTPETATFQNTLQPILVNDDETVGENFRVCFLQNVHPDAAVREASLKADGKIREVEIDLRMRDDIFQRVKTIYNNRASANLDTEFATILEKEYIQYVTKGLLLPPGPERDHFKEQQLELSRLCLESQNNHNNEMGGVWFTPEQLEGIPKTDIDVDELEKGTGENEGKVKADFKYTTSTPLFKYAKNETTRRDYFIAEANKVNQNVPIFQKIIELRDETARQAGYKDHADITISAKMAKDSEKVKAFLADIRTRVGDGGKKELDVLRELKKQDYAERGLEFDGEIYAWDTSYYSRILKEKEYSLDENEVAEYFPMWKTFAGMLEIFEKILGLHFVELDEAAKARLSPTGNAKDIVWHDEVVVISVWNDDASGGEFVGYLLLDLHPRPNKYGHNANFSLGPGYVKADGTRNYPCTALVCNFSRPSQGRPALLKHSEAVTLFHELGHGIHDLVGKTKTSYCHGTAVMWDFVEAPSQMLENWCWTPDVLQGLSSHWKSGEKISKDLVDKLVKTKHLNEAMGTLFQILIGTFDLTVHSPDSHEAVKQLNCARLWNQLRAEISGVKGPEEVGYGMEWGQKHATIGHFVGGYDAGYYGYLYSKVFSTDMFYTAFKENPMDGEAGRRYRKLVLERGGSMDENVMLREFLGREPNPENFYKDLGLP